MIKIYHCRVHGTKTPLPHFRLESLFTTFLGIDIWPNFPNGQALFLLHNDVDWFVTTDFVVIQYLFQHVKL